MFSQKAFVLIVLLCLGNIAAFQPGFLSVQECTTLLDRIYDCYTTKVVVSAPFASKKCCTSMSLFVKSGCYCPSNCRGNDGDIDTVLQDLVLLDLGILDIHQKCLTEEPEAFTKKPSQVLDTLLRTPDAPVDSEPTVSHNTLDGVFLTNQDSIIVDKDSSAVEPHRPLQRVQGSDLLYDSSEVFSTEEEELVNAVDLDSFRLPVNNEESKNVASRASVFDTSDTDNTPLYLSDAEDIAAYQDKLAAAQALASCGNTTWQYSAWTAAVHSAIDSVLDFFMIPFSSHSEREIDTDHTSLYMKYRTIPDDEEDLDAYYHKITRYMASNSEPDGSSQWENANQQPIPRSSQLTSVHEYLLESSNTDEDDTMYAQNVQTKWNTLQQYDTSSDEDTAYLQYMSMLATHSEEASTMPGEDPTKEASQFFEEQFASAASGASNTNEAAEENLAENGFRPDLEAASYDDWYHVEEAANMEEIAPVDITGSTAGSSTIQPATIQRNEEEMLFWKQVDDYLPEDVAAYRRSQPDSSDDSQPAKATEDALKAAIATEDALKAAIATEDEDDEDFDPTTVYQSTTLSHEELEDAVKAATTLLALPELAESNVELVAGAHSSGFEASDAAAAAARDISDPLWARTVAAESQVDDLVSTGSAQFLTNSVFDAADVGQNVDKDAVEFWTYNGLDNLKYQQFQDQQFVPAGTFDPVMEEIEMMEMDAMDAMREVEDGADSSNAVSQDLPPVYKAFAYAGTVDTEEVPVVHPFAGVFSADTVLTEEVPEAHPVAGVFFADSSAGVYSFASAGTAEEVRREALSEESDDVFPATEVAAPVLLQQPTGDFYFDEYHEVNSLHMLQPAVEADSTQPQTLTEKVSAAARKAGPVLGGLHDSYLRPIINWVCTHYWDILIVLSAFNFVGFAAMLARLYYLETRFSSRHDRSPDSVVVVNPCVKYCDAQKAASSREAFLSDMAFTLDHSSYEDQDGLDDKRVPLLASQHQVDV